MATRILDENQASKNKENNIDQKLPRKIRSAVSLATITAQKSSNLNKGKIMGVENVAAKQGISVKGRTRRKALADVTNLSINGSNQCTNDSSNGLKLKKDKMTGGATLLKDKTAKNSICRPRISVTKSVVIGNISTIHKKENLKTSAVASSKLTTNAETRRRRNTCAEINSCLSHQINQLTKSTKLTKDHGKKISRPRLSLATQKAPDADILSRKRAGENTKSSLKAIAKSKIVTHAETNLRRKPFTEINSCNYSQANQSIGSSKIIKNQGIKVSRPRLSFVTQKATDEKNTLRKPVGTRSTNILASSKLKKAPTVKRKSNVEVSLAKKQSEPNVRTSFNDESISSQVDGNSSSSDNVTVIISRSKRNRRKSYTSSLVAQSEILGELKEHPINDDDVRDIDDNKNLLDVVEYVDDIYQYYWSMEVQNPLPANHMSIQSDITPRMRGILVNWLIEVHLKFHLMQETLFLMVQLLDRVLSVVPTKKDELQMVGLTTLLLASKYEDYWHPKINELVGLSANSFTRDQMLAMEKRLLKILRFRLNLPTPYVFMLRFLKAADSDNKLEQLAFYLVEICLGEYEALKYKPSLLCASAIYVARCTLNVAPVWTSLLRKHTRYNESQLRSCAEMVLKYHRAACLQPTRITYEKYLSTDRGCVAALAALEKLPVSI